MATTLYLPILTLLLLTLGDVISFSIRHRAEKSPNLADSLAILQRHRRRVNRDFLPSESDLLDDEPLTLQDVSDWLNGAAPRVGSNSIDLDNNAIAASWLRNLGDFKDFEPSDLGYDLDPALYPPAAPVKASPHEIEAIFETEAKETPGTFANVKRQDNPTLSKKTKEEMVNVRGDKPAAHRPSNSASRKRATPKEDRVLNSLTKQEVKVLMKAVGKLQQQLSDDNDDDGDNENGRNDDVDLARALLSSDLPDAEPQNDESIVVSEPVSEEELKSVFEETDGPITKETKVILEKEPGDKEPTLVEEQVISENLPDTPEEAEDEDVENELTKALTNELANELKAEEESEQEAAEEAAADVAAAVENANEAAEDDEEDILDDGEQLPLGLNSPESPGRYWLLNNDKFLLGPDKNHLKRTAKRASGVYLDDISGGNSRSADVPKPLSSLGHLASGKGHGQVTLSWLSPQLQAFVMKIISLQDEVDRLKMEARLEDLENDALTDALNEATLAQKEGTVSDVEWTSLQQAIQLEAALQDIKHSKPASIVDDDEEVDDGGDDDDALVPGLDSDGTDIKRAEPWRRKREPSLVMDQANDVMEDVPGSDFSLSVYRGRDNALKNDAVEKLLEQSYFLNNRPDDDVEEDTNDIASLFMSNPERCPAVQRYSSNCALADVYGVPVDFEARALCNLHEMCYACGKSLGVDQSQCDLVYRTAASSLCKGKEQCKEEAEVFLRAMKLRTRYMTHAQPTCRSRCTAEFLGMF